MKWPLDKKIVAGIGLALAMLAVIGVFQHRTIQALVEADGWVAHTNAVLTELEGAFSAIQDVESRGRGYVAMGQERFAGQIEASISDVEGHLQAFRRLTADNPRQQRDLGRLEPLAKRKSAFMLRLIALRRDQGLAAAQQLLDGGEGLRLMDEIRSLVDAMRADENALLQRHQAASLAAARAAGTVSTTGTIVAVGLILWASWIIQRDATRRKRAEEEVHRLNAELEQRVRQRTSELQAANKELDSFSYSVSHDLRSPLRAMDGFTRILLEEHRRELAPEAQRYLEIIRNSAVHLGALIDGLLAFARLGRQDVNRRTVAMDSLARHAIEDLGAEREGRQVELIVGSLPSCEGDPVLLRQVFVNLLSNALKYTRPRELARIEIGSLRLEEMGASSRSVAAADCPVYYVRDNGVGFDARYRHKLFGVFQRLHRQEEFEGTGVGLATVQRIIHKHEGAVWAEAEVDQGATFYFTVGDSC